MSVFKYQKYKVAVAADSKRSQGLRMGDVVRRQYFDAPNLIYSLMVVLETGVDIIGEKESAYFIGALVEGDEPQAGQLLDFVRVTNLFDTDRSGALYLTASDSQAPFMDVIDGLAKDYSLCWPVMGKGQPDVADRDKYACLGSQCLTTEYREQTDGASRAFRIMRNAEAVGGNKLGFKQTIAKSLEHPQRLVISFKARASREMPAVPLSFGYTNGAQVDGSDTVDILTGWRYKLSLVTIDYPKQYSRSFLLDLTQHLLAEGDWCEIADLNIVLLSDIATFAQATKARVGKVTGVVDPLFGVLDGYGAYFQNLYATKNVNIAGTLTAGDENGFASTFYVGKIHKNVIRNSVEGTFIDAATVRAAEQPPAGIGHVWKIGGTSKMYVQSAEWRSEHIDRDYCFSIWIKATQNTVVSVYQDEHLLRDIAVDVADGWRRYYVSFRIRESYNAELSMRLDASAAGLLISSPQMEAGSTPSQYQATDGTLSYVEDYGAWFNKGGIGGTIQNPLLRLNEDGSISSRNRSFVINPDGTGHFASGRFRWTEDTITLQDVTIRWEDFSDDVKDNLKAKSVTLSGTDIFHFSDLLDEAACEPSEIHIFAAEHGFIATDRSWQYQKADGNWKNISGYKQDFFKLLPSFNGWEGRDVLTLRYQASYGDTKYEATHTISKLYDGADAYSVYIHSTKGNVFRGGVISTTLSAQVFKGGVDVTDSIPWHNFQWKRVSENAQSDAAWNATAHTGKTLEVTGEDVYYKAVFDCEIKISKT